MEYQTELEIETVLTDYARGDLTARQTKSALAGLGFRADLRCGTYAFEIENAETGEFSEIEI